MKEKIEYKFGEFTDFSGQVRKFTVAAVSRVVNMLYISSYDMAFNGNPCINKTLSIGIAICNPSDTYDEETGKRIAYNKAVSDGNSLVLYATSAGIINTKMVDALIDQEIDYFKNYPESHIQGYKTAERKYFDKQAHCAEVFNLKQSLTASELDTVHYLKNITDEKRDIILKLISED